MNIGTFAGYVGRDSEFKTLPSGQKVLNFSIGVSVGFGDKKETLWVACALWGDRAEKLAQYVMKGTSLCVSGDITVRAYSAKDGTPKAEMICNVQRLTLQGAAKERETPAQQPTAAEAPKQTAADFDDPIPF